MSRLTKNQEDYLFNLRRLDEKIDDRERAHLLRELAEIPCSPQELNEVYSILEDESQQDYKELSPTLREFIRYSTY